MTYYDILEISEKASPEVIRMAYKALCKKYHPDIYQGDKSYAEEKMKQINEAYDTLSDETKKSQYDATLSGQGNCGQNSYQPPRQDSYSAPKRESGAFNFIIMLGLGFSALEEGNWAFAEAAFDNIISQMPNSAEAYLGKLMAELHVRKREDLKRCPRPFNDKLNYARAYRYGDASLKQFLNETIQFINKRNHEEKCNRIYRYACSLMNGAQNIQLYEEAIAEFEKIRGFKDADKQIEYCYKRISEINSAILAAQAEKEKRAAEREQFIADTKEKIKAKLPLFKKIAIIVIPLLIVAIVAATVLPAIDWGKKEPLDTANSTISSGNDSSEENSSDTTTSTESSSEESSKEEGSEPSTVLNSKPTTNKPSSTNKDYGSKEIYKSEEDPYSDSKCIIDYNSASQMIYKTFYNEDGSIAIFYDYQFDASGKNYTGFIEKQFHENGQVSYYRVLEGIPSTIAGLGFYPKRIHKEYYYENGEIKETNDVEYEYFNTKHFKASYPKSALVYQGIDKILTHKYVYKNTLNNGEVSIIETCYTYDSNGAIIDTVVTDRGNVEMIW